MAGIDHKIRILKRSIATFHGWLDSCEELLKSLPSELESCKPSQLRELALKYKDLLLQMKERCSYMQEVNNLCKEIGEATDPEQTEATPSPSLSQHDPKLAELATDVKDLNTRFASSCMQARQHYASLSNTLATAIQEKESLRSFSFAVSSQEKLNASSSAPSPSHVKRSSPHKQKKQHDKSDLSGTEATDGLLKEELSSMPDDAFGNYRNSSNFKPKNITPKLSNSSNSSTTASQCLDHSTGFTLPASISGRRVSEPILPSSFSTSAQTLSIPLTPNSEANGANPRPKTSTPVTHNNMQHYKHQEVVLDGSSVCTPQTPSKDSMSQPTSYSVTNTSPAKSNINTPSCSNIEYNVKMRRFSRQLSSNSIGSVVSQDSVLNSKSSGRRRRPISAVIVAMSEKDLTKARRRLSGDYDRIAHISETSDSPRAFVPISSDTEEGKSFLVPTKTGSLGDLLAGDRASIASLDSLDPRPIIGDHFVSESSSAQALELGGSVATDVRWNLKSAGFNGSGGGMQLDARRCKSMDALDVKSRPVELSERLKEMSMQMQEFIHSIAENRHCGLQSLALELHLGEMKAMSSILEVQQRELLTLRAAFSSTAKQQLNARKLKHPSPQRNLFSNFSHGEVLTNKEEIIKLCERVELLQKHCKDSIQQVDEVLEFVMQYEGEIKGFKNFLAGHKATVEQTKKEKAGYSEESWTKLKEALTFVNERKTQLQSIQDLSTHLLYLEPIFDGRLLRSDLQALSETYHGLIVEIFELLETLARNKADQLLLDVSVLSSWVTENGLTVQALARKARKPGAGMNSKLVTTRNTLLQEVENKKSLLSEISDRLHPITSILSPEDNHSLADLMAQVNTNTKALAEIENGLRGIDVGGEHSVVPVGDRGENSARQLESKVNSNNSNHIPNGHVVQRNKPERKYTEIDIGSDRNPSLFPTSTAKSGHGLSLLEQIDGAQNGLDKRPSDIPPVLYERVEEILPSPLIEYNLIPSRSLDVAIEQLPRQLGPRVTLPSNPIPSPLSTSSLTHSITPVPPSQITPLSPPPSHGRSSSGPNKIRYVEIDLSFDSDPKAVPKSSSASNLSHRQRAESGKSPPQYAVVRKTKKGRKEHPKRMSLHEDLLEFISNEWSSLEKASSFPSADEVALDESISHLESREQRAQCVAFVQGVRELEASLKGVSEQISVIHPPKIPDLEKVHTSIDQCQKLRDRLSKLHPTLDKYNEDSLGLVISLGRSPSCSRVGQLTEILLFDVSTLWHTTNMNVASCMRELREREADINTLYRHLQTISRVLGEARNLLEEKQNVTDVDQYLDSCKIMHNKLTGLADRRAHVAANIKESVLHNPQLPVCQDLLDQLKQVDTQWVNTVRELSQVPLLEPLLIKKTFTNISRELVDIGTAIKHLENRSLKSEDAEANYKACQNHLQRITSLKSSLRRAESNMTTLSDQNSTVSDIVNQVESDGVKVNQIGVSETTSNTQQVSDDITPFASNVDYKDLQERCHILTSHVNRFVSEVETLEASLQIESDLLNQFYKEIDDLDLWIKDTVSMFQLSSSAGNGSDVTSSSGDGGFGTGGASVAQLRGKHQAICQQVMTRQPKLESAQSLAAEVLQIPSNQEERQKIEERLTSLFNDWDKICQQCVPAGVLPMVTTPTGASGSLKFKPPLDFEDVSQMVEWLILIESKLQPQKIIVGDFVHLKKLLKDIQSMEKELMSRKRDYKWFMGGIRASMLSISQSSDFDSESSLTRSAIMAAGKSVKFDDENTLERRRRQTEIDTQKKNDGDADLKSSTTQLNGIDSAAQSASAAYANVTKDLADSSKKEARYHSQGPETGNHAFRPHGLLFRHQSSLEARMFDSPSLSSQIMTPGTPISDEVYQLMVLWKGVWSSIKQQKQRLESIEVVWKEFESKKEAFSGFLVKAEERVRLFFKVLSTTKDLTVMQAEIEAQKTFANEVQTYNQCLSSLNEMSHDLMTNHHHGDDTRDLQDTMTDLNLRWRTTLQIFSQHQSTIASLCTRWTEFYRDYYNFQLWLRNMDTDMSNLNPFVHDMTAVKTQLEKILEIHQELHSKSGALESVRLLAHKLLQGVGGSHIHAAAIHARLDNVSRRWDHLQKLSMERKSALEQALSEKQDFLSNLADCLAWLNQAEKHLASQKPLGSNYYTVREQCQAQQGFWHEVVEQQSKIEALIASGKQTAMETHWPHGTAESVRQQFSSLEERWKKLWSEGEEWGQLLEMIYPEMERFQSTCTDCGQKLTDAEMKMVKLEPPATKMSVLQQQQEALHAFENVLVSIGNVLESLVLSQKHQIQLGVKVTPDLLQLVKRYHQRWNDLKQKIEVRHASINRAMVKYDPAKLGIAELPRGWQRIITENGTPYYVSTFTGTRAQWHHPELSMLYAQLKIEHTFPSYPSTAYPIALKLRAIQKRTKLSLLEIRQAMEVYELHSIKCPANTPAEHILSPYEVTCLAVDMFQRIEEAQPELVESGKFYLNSAVELTTCWLRDVYDVTHEGMVNCLSYHLAAICMSSSKLEEKYSALFQIISRGQNSIDVHQLTQFLEHIVQIPQSVCNAQFCSLHSLDVCAKECFRKHVGVGRLQLPHFIAWLHTEPPPLAWLPVLHRLAASEATTHNVKCRNCKTHSFKGFRYRCVQCNSFDMCQTCYWSGKTGKGHDRSKHYMEEYCIPKSSDDMRDFFKTLQKSFRRKKNKPLNQQQGAQASKNVGGANHTHLSAKQSPKSSPSKKRHSTYVAINVGDSPHRSSLAVGDDHESHPGRRFTVNEDFDSAWRNGQDRERIVTLKVPAPRQRRRLSDSDFPPSDLHLTSAAAGYPQGREWQKTKPPRDLEASFSKLDETRKNLSQRLDNIRSRRPTAQSPEIEVTSRSCRDEKLPTPEEQLINRNSFLQGRVQVLEEHNKQLENCIGQLKMVASLHTQQQPNGTRRYSPTPPNLPHQNGTLNYAHPPLPRTIMPPRVVLNNSKQCTQL